MSCKLGLSIKKTILENKKESFFYKKPQKIFYPSLRLSKINHVFYILNQN